MIPFAFFLLIRCLLVCGKIFFIIHTKTAHSKPLWSKEACHCSSRRAFVLRHKNCVSCFQVRSGPCQPFHCLILTEGKKLTGIYFTGSVALNSLSADSLDAASQIKISLQQVLHASFNRRR